MPLFDAVQSAPVMGKTGAIPGPDAIDDLAATQGDHPDKIVLTFTEVDGGAKYEIWSHQENGAGAKIGEHIGTAVDGTPVSLDITRDGSGDIQDTYLTASHEPTLIAPDSNEVHASDGVDENKIEITFEPGSVQRGASRWYSVVSVNSSGGRTDMGGQVEGYMDDPFATTEIWVSGTESDDIGDYSLLDTADTSPYSHTGLSADTDKYYKLRTKTENANYSSYTTYEAGATGGVGVAAPDIPTGLSATQGNHHSKVVLSWSQVSGATGYEVWSGPAGTPVDESDVLKKIADIGSGATVTFDVTAAHDPYLSAPELTAPSGIKATKGAYLDEITVEFTAGQLQQGRTRRFYLRAVNAGGPSGLSNFVDGYRGGSPKGAKISKYDSETGGFVPFVEGQSSPFHHVSLSPGTEVKYVLQEETTNGLESPESGEVEGNTAVEGAGIYSAPVVGWTRQGEPYRKWLFSTASKGWRQINTAKNVDALFIGENAELLSYDKATGLIGNFSKREDVGVRLRTKTFVTGTKRPEMVRYLIITYRSETSLTLELYSDNKSVMDEMYVLPPQRVDNTFSIRLSYRAKKFVAVIYGTKGSMTRTHFGRILFDNKVA